MANKTLTELTSAGALDGTENVYLKQGGNSRKGTTDQVRDFVLTDVDQDITPAADGTRDLGSASRKFAEGWFDQLYGLRPTLHYQERYASGNDAGGATGSSYNTRVLNTSVTNTITGASVSSNQVTLPAGTYTCIARAPSYATDRHKLVLYNVTDTAVELTGSSCLSGSSGAVQTQSEIQQTFTIADTKVFELRHYCQTSKTLNGLGVATSSGDPEIYAEVIFHKLA